MNSLRGGNAIFVKLLKDGRLPQTFTVQDLLDRLPQNSTKTQATGIIQYGLLKGTVVSLGKQGRKALYCAAEDQYKVEQKKILNPPSPPQAQYTPVEIHPADILMQKAISAVVSSLNEQIISSENRIVDRVVSSLLVALPKRGYEESRPPAPTIPDSFPEEIPSMGGPRKFRVLIVGLMPNQKNIIRDYCGDILDLRFIKGSLTNLRSKAEGADLVLGYTKFMNHKEDYLISSTNTRYITVQGGLTSLKQELDKVMEKETRPT